LLKRWLDEGALRRFVVNVKLPQEHPDPALEPLEACLRGVRGLRFRIRQLYHDRREVTVMGETTR
jgi:23S rRNA C2498 (ribose-2'-O)-methylase RlmM